jgi:hypothetical protein
MKERPILFKGPMVRAILDGRKTQTRRIVKAKDSDPKRCITLSTLMANVNEWRLQNGRWFGIDGYDTLVFADCPYGQVGDRLWVRETWASSQPNIVAYRANGEAGALIGDGGGGRLWVHHGYILEAPGYPFGLENLRTIGLGKFGGKWKPSIHMPRWASRITLEITGVRVERLNDISEQDANTEGCPPPLYDDLTGTHQYQGLPFGAGPRQWLCSLWLSINGKDSWAANPWVWVVEFKRIDA